MYFLGNFLVFYRSKMACRAYLDDKTRCFDFHGTFVGTPSRPSKRLLGRLEATSGPNGSYFIGFPRVPNRPFIFGFLGGWLQEGHFGGSARGPPE